VIPKVSEEHIASTFRAGNNHIVLTVSEMLSAPRFDYFIMHVVVNK
jgi:hypothetical protein